MSAWSPYGQAQDWEGGLVSAHRAASMLSAGSRPPPIPAPIHLRPGEQCYAQAPVQLLQYLGGDPTYTQTFAFGTGLLGLGLVAGSLIGNSIRARRAAEEAAPRFRVVDEGLLYVTDARFAIHGGHHWSDLWFTDVRASSFDDWAIELCLSGIPPIRLWVWPAGYYYVLFRWLANGEILDAPPAPQPIAAPAAYDDPRKRRRRG